mgnify:CR=1 FL=1
MSFAQSWKSIPEAAKAQSTDRPEVADLRDGIYTVEVIGFRFFTAGPDAKYPGQQYYSFGLRVSKGPRGGAYVEKFSSATEVGLEILKKDLRRITGRWVGPEEVYDEERDMTGPVRNEVVGAVLEMQKSTSKPDKVTGKTYPRFNFIKLVRAATGPTGAVDEPAEDEPDPARDAGEPAGLPDEPTGEFLEDPESDDDVDGDDDDDDIPF